MQLLILRQQSRYRSVCIVCADGSLSLVLATGT